MYLVRDRVLWFPDEEFGIQCVARTRKGKQCLNDLAHSAPFKLQPWWERGSVGDVHDVKYLRHSNEFAYRMYEQQRCYVHVDSDAPDAIAPGWEAYDPALHRRTKPCPLDLRCRDCGFFAVVDQVLVPRLGPCPACGHTDWRDLGRHRWDVDKPGWRLVEAIPVDQRPVLHLE
ncbi:hypothetical protein [Actinomadura sp. WAC 06369]|uniref:hypothetical protein n=1 Tax=Actinomadura sp. WAC 06369 TaxID=2203193 RepID=UPI000F7AEFE5|nr:hypothetical protein [Actinomadura sp. WAC 06369]